MKAAIIHIRALRILREAGYAEQQAHTAGQQPRPNTALLPALPWPAPRVAEGGTANVEHLPEDLLPDARPFIKEGAMDDCSLVSEVAERCKFSGKRLDRVLRALIPLSRFVELRVLHIGLRSRPPKWVRVTETGFIALGLTPPESTRPGAQCLHRFWLERVARKLRKLGYVKVLIDTAVAGKRVDVVALTADGQWDGFEVELQDAQKDLVHNVTEDLTACNLARVTVLVTTRSQAKKAARTLKEQLTKDLLARVGIEPLGKYL